MRIWLIVLLFAALVVEIWAVFKIDHTIEVEASPRVTLMEQFQTGTLPIGDQLAARAKSMAAEYAAPKGPSNPDLGERIVRGKIVSGSKPAAGADVTLDQRAVADGVNIDGYPSQAHWRVNTTDSGFFEFRGLPKGSFVLRACFAEEVAFAHVTLTDKEFACERMLTLAPSAPITGIVQDASGSPVSSALVFPFPAENHTTSADVRLMAFLPALTDADGRFAFAHAPGMCKFLINVPSKGPWISNAVSPGTRDIVFEAEPPGAVTGSVVRDEDGRPFANLVVRVEALTYPLMARRVKADASGRFRCEGLPAGKYRVMPDSDRLLVTGSAPEVQVGTGGVSEASKIAVRRARSARGRIVDEEGLGLSGMWVVARGGAREITARTDQAGYYVLLGLAQGDYTVHVRGAGGFDVDSGGSNTLAVTDAPDVAGPNFIIRPGAGRGQIACLVKDVLGQPAAGAILYYCAESPGDSATDTEQESGAVLTDAQGRFTWDGVPRDWRFWVYASKQGYISRPFGWATLAASAEQSIELTLDTQRYGTISGAVVDALERPAVGMTVVARLTDARPGWPAQIAAVTSTDGSFELTGCAEGAYVVAVGESLDASGQLRESLRETPVAIGATGNINGLRLVLP